MKYTFLVRKGNERLYLLVLICIVSMVGRKSSFDSYLQRLRKYYFKHRDIPSFRELTMLLEVKSKKTVHNFFQQLIDRGYCTKEDGRYIPTNKFSGLPYFSSVPAGGPTLVEDAVEDRVSVEQYLVDMPDSAMLIKVQGDSMEDAGIVDGDVVVINTKKQPRFGDIVVGVVDNAYTLKFFMKDPEGNSYLKAANARKNYDDIYAHEELRILGVVTGSFRKY